jgi:hypothetical protein
MKKPPLTVVLLNNIYFDTCVLPGIDLLTNVIRIKNILLISKWLTRSAASIPRHASIATTPKDTSAHRQSPARGQARAL